MKSQKPAPFSAIEAVTPETSGAVREQAIAWLLRLRAATASQAERAAFQTWLAANPDHRQLYGMVQAQWQWMEQFTSLPFSARDHALGYRRKPRRLLLVYGAAAGLLLVFALTAGLPDSWLGIPQTYTVGKGLRQTIVLADGSRIELNTDSEVRVRFNYWRRNVELVKGEAFFTVKPDAHRLFEVTAGNGHIRDRGTAFDVYKKNAQVIVAVQEGIVEVQAAGKRQLNAGQQLCFNDKGLFQTVQGQDISDLTAWREGYVVFRNRRLDDVLTEIGRYHDTHIHLQNPGLGGLKVSGTFLTGNVDDLLKAVAVILPVKVDYLNQREVLLTPIRR